MRNKQCRKSFLIALTQVPPFGGLLFIHISFVTSFPSYSPCISLNLFNFELFPDLREEYNSSILYLFTNLPSRFKHLLFLVFYHK
jgi:hypothetical protein